MPAPARFTVAASADRDVSDAPVGSPCISICQMNAATGLCDGCLRTIGEIAAWGGMTEAQRRECWQQLRQRGLRRLPEDR